MTGLQNITANNGWAMAAVGAAIVFMGLVALTFAISQIHKILLLWEKRQADLKRKKIAPTVEAIKSPLPAVADYCPLDIPKLVDLYRPLVEKLGESFQLVQLYQLSKDMDLPHPHLSIKCLREADILVSKGDGIFIWNQPQYNN